MSDADVATRLVSIKVELQMTLPVELTIPEIIAEFHEGYKPVADTVDIIPLEVKDV